MTKTILVTNGLLNKSLAVVRSLRRQDLRVVVAEKTRIHVSGFSKYAEKSLVYPDPNLFEGQFLDWLRTTITREKVDLLLPTDDDTLRLIVSHQDELRKITRLVVPSEEAFQSASNKALTYTLAEKSLGFLFPKLGFQP